MLNLRTLYTYITTTIEVIAYSVLLGLTVSITRTQTGYISSISESMSLSNGISVFYNCIIYIFSIERNGYEFYTLKNIDQENTKLCAVYWLRIIFLNCMLLFLTLIGVITNRRDRLLHGQIAACA